MTIAVISAIGLVGSACGDDPPTAEELAAIDALVETELTVEEQRCILDGITRLGITAAQIVAGELTADQDGEVLSTTLECVEDLATVESFVDSFIAGAAQEGAELTRDEARCAIRALDADEPGDAIRACLGERVVDLTFGDDPVLDLLVEQCRRGNNQACDELHATSPIGSEYETYGRTCGGRAPAGASPSCFDQLG
ncbi:MAG: hypothetical protein ACPHIC_00175 [Acidimicrobiales bacterium]